MRLEEEKQASEGGIYIPEVAREKQCYAHVMALGTGKPDFQFFVAEGDTVLFTRYAGSQIDLGLPGTFLLLRQDDILGVVNTDVNPSEV